MTPHGRATRVLVLWYGLFQLVHFFFNGVYLLNPGTPPFHAPPGGWHPQLVAFLNGMAFLDWLNCVAALAFVGGFLRARPWAGWLGTLALTISVYAAAVFVWGTVASGANGLGRPYLFANLPFVPVLILFGAWCYWGLTGRLGSIAKATQD